MQKEKGNARVERREAAMKEAEELDELLLKYLEK